MSWNLSLPSTSPDWQTYTPAVSRAFDVLVSGVALVLLFPLLVPIALAVKLTSKGPVLQREQRAGRWGLPFTGYLIRCHYVEAGSRAEEERLTPTGAFLRRTHLYRLPQLVNVLRGEMSLVGPEPQPQDCLGLFTPEQRQILMARPGLVSPRQVYARNRTATEGTGNWGRNERERLLEATLALELAYLQRRTFRSDLALLFAAAVKVLIGDRNPDWLLRLRNRHFFLIDIVTLAQTPALSLIMLEDGLGWWPDDIPALLLFTLISLLVKTAALGSLGLYRRFWPYASVNELTLLLVAVGLSTGLLTVGFAAAHSLLVENNLALFRALPFLDGLLSSLAICGSRFGVRGLYHWHRRLQLTFGGQRVLVVGAGEAGMMAVKEMQANPSLEMAPVAFVDDDLRKVGTRIQGIPVLGTTGDILPLVHRSAIDRIIIAVPSAPPRRQWEIVALCKKTGAVIDRIPGMYELLAGYKTVNYRPRSQINHFLRRNPVETDQSGLYGLLRGATALVTGAGGSIGSELCRQIAQFDPKMIVLLGHGENSIFEAKLDLSISFPLVTIIPVIADVRDREHVRSIVQTYRPDVIFHAAAHKHVPFMEASIDEAVTNNVLGTYNVLGAAEEFGIERLVLISTDKAINPVNVMGATKRIAELLVMAAAQRSGRAYMSVRFGNVLGSRGSVLRVFQQQIEGGGPVTVTHPEMYRYFMSIPEAVQLVLQAAVLGRAGEVFVLDMGEPIRIEDLAIELIRLFGFVPRRDIEIVYTGIRPGEKLREELFMENESFERTKHQKIFVATRRDSIDGDMLNQEVVKLVTLAREMRTQETIQQMRAIIPEYRPLSHHETVEVPVQSWTSN